jgi:phage terminase large subunit
MRAYRYGDWDALGGGYFKEFQYHVHMRKAFRIPDHWPRYRSFDYGLDRLACVWWAIDTDGRAWAYRAVEEKNLIVQEAAAMIMKNSPAHEKIMATYAPWDMWSRSKESGKTMASTFIQSGVPIIQAPRERVQGHMAIKTMLAPMPLKDPYVISLFPEGKVPKTLPGLMLFDDLTRVANDIRDIQADEKNVNDCAKVPHEVTHNVDAVRYFCITQVLPAEQPAEKKHSPYGEDEEENQTYEHFMCGGEPNNSYMMTA